MAWAPPGFGSVVPGRPGLEHVPCSYQPGWLRRNKRRTRRPPRVGGSRKVEVPMRGLEGRTYIVTGAASGIGRATAARLLEEGASVMGADLGAEPAAAPRAVSKGSHWAYTRCDVTDEVAVETLVAATVQLGGAVDGLVN